MSLMHRLRENKLVGTAYRRLRTLAQGPGWGGFHRDPIYGGAVLDLLGAFDFTAFVETGTFRGYSTELVASRFPKLPTYSVEVVRETYDAARRFLGRFPNIRLSQGTSDEWIAGLLKTGELGPRPFFYLDAHWQTYWPLRAELKHIGDARLTTVIVIDDFEVPGREQFGFDIDGGGARTAGEKCNLDYVRPALNPANSYRALYPKYRYADAFNHPKGALRGHIILFQNMDDAYEATLKRPHFQTHYEAYGPVL
jgi:hypothetical protein